MATMLTQRGSRVQGGSAPVVRRSLTEGGTPQSVDRPEAYPPRLLGDVVEHAGLVEEGLELGDELFVSVVREIDFQAGLVGEGDEEAVGEAVVETFGADVGAPLEGLHGVDFLGQGDEGVLDGLHLLRLGAVLELKEHNVAVGGVSGR